MVTSWLGSPLFLLFFSFFWRNKRFHRSVLRGYRTRSLARAVHHLRRRRNKIKKWSLLRRRRRVVWTCGKTLPPRVMTSATWWERERKRLLSRTCAALQRHAVVWWRACFAPLRNTCPRRGSHRNTAGKIFLCRARITRIVITWPCLAIIVFWIR